MPEKDYLLEKYNKRYGSSTSYFCVFRVGKSIKGMSGISAFEKHMERQMEVFNADPEKMKYNRVLIGSQNILNDVQDYIKDIPNIRKNGVIAKDLVLTSNLGFFKGLAPGEFEKWIESNINFLKIQYGENCVYAVLHMDETTPHIHALIVPKFYNQERGYYQLNNSRYFDGREKLREWQDLYSRHMGNTFNNLIRGIRGSKAKHIDIKTYYSLINSKEMSSDKLLAQAKENYLLKKEVGSLKATLKKIDNKEEQDKIKEQLNAAAKNNTVYQKTIREISKKFNISEKQILKIIDDIQKGKDKEKER